MTDKVDNVTMTGTVASDAETFGWKTANALHPKMDRSQFRVIGWSNSEGSGFWVMIFLNFDESKKWPGIVHVTGGKVTGSVWVKDYQYIPNLYSALRGESRKPITTNEDTNVQKKARDARWKSFLWRFQQTYSDSYKAISYNVTGGVVVLIVHLKKESSDHAVGHEEISLISPTQDGEKLYGKLSPTSDQLSFSPGWMFTFDDIVKLETYAFGPLPGKEDPDPYENPVRGGTRSHILRGDTVSAINKEFPNIDWRMFEVKKQINSRGELTASVYFKSTVNGAKKLVPMDRESSYQRIWLEGRAVPFPNLWKVSTQENQYTERDAVVQPSSPSPYSNMCQRLDQYLKALESQLPKRSQDGTEDDYYSPIGGKAWEYRDYLIFGKRGTKSTFPSNWAKRAEFVIQGREPGLVMVRNTPPARFTIKSQQVLGGKFVFKPREYKKCYPLSGYSYITNSDKIHNFRVYVSEYEYFMSHLPKIDIPTRTVRFPSYPPNGRPSNMSEQKAAWISDITDGLLEKDQNIGSWTYSGWVEGDPYYQTILATYCATHGCGVSIEHLKSGYDGTKSSSPVHPVITSIMRYHLYFTIRKLVDRMKSGHLGLSKDSIQSIAAEFGATKMVDGSRVKGQEKTFEITVPCKKQTPYLFKLMEDYKTHYIRYINIDSPTKKGMMTPTGLRYINDSIESYVYSVLGAQARTRVSITSPDPSGGSKQCQAVFRQIVEDTISDHSITAGILNMNSAISDTGVVLDLAICPGAWIVPGRMVILEEKIPGYNNNLRVTPQYGISFGLNRKLNRGDTKIQRPTPPTDKSVKYSGTTKSPQEERVESIASEDDDATSDATSDATPKNSREENDARGRRVRSARVERNRAHANRLIVTASITIAGTIAAAIVANYMFGRN